MAVYTKLDREQVEEIVNKYDIGTLEKYNGINKGIMNSNYLLETDKAKYILRILEGDRDLETEKKELEFLEYLSENGIPCPEVLINKKNEDYILINGKMASIFAFLKGSEVLDVNSSILYKFGKILAKMHKLSKGMILERKEKIEMKHLFSFISSDKKKLKKLLAENYDIITEKYKKLKERDFISLPSGIIHNDIFPDNVFTLDGEITGVIDFNDSITGNFLHDIAIVINFWIYNKKSYYDEELIENFLKGYTEVRDLTEEEKELLPLALDEAVLTFIFLRIKKFDFHVGEDANREFKDFRDLIPMAKADKKIKI